MSPDKIEIAIIKDSKKNDAELQSMSLEVARAFLVLAESLTTIAELTPNNQNLTINITPGSVRMAVEGAVVARINKNFQQIVDNNSTDKDLIAPWRNMQSVFQKNGLEYSAIMFLNNQQISVVDILKGKKRLIAKSKKEAIKTSIEFIEGKLFEIGGKRKQNIHLTIPNGNTVTVACTEANALRANNYLFQTILISTWVSVKAHKKYYELYHPQQLSIYNDLKNFINSFENSVDEIESLSKLHDECRKYLDKQDYGSFRKFLKLFNHKTTDINSLHTILLLTQFFKNNKRLSELISDLDALFNSKIDKYNKLVDANQN